ncbi:unnamed protein product [Microthlaspi erraticum]|uniref:F-box domain-containing protein n=1 Tax=Microthlaspi erraticum TaxID=1685480 RepID=A0A6D2HKD3_9BRAS|nr:unnamed protein product [Microthlaspi erraticum]
MYSPKKKRTKKKPTTPQSNLIPSLPYDLLLNCIARTSRLNYLTLSQVSKSVRSLLASPELYKVRSLLGHAERCLYVCINTGSYEETWYTLCRKPDYETLTSSKERKTSSRYGLATLLSVPHSPCIETLGALYSFETAGIDEKFHEATRSYMWRSDWSHCEIGNVLYSVTRGVNQKSNKALKWYDTEEKRWRKLERLVGLPDLPADARVRLANYGGKMAVLWEFDHLIPGSWPSNLTKRVWCAVIELESLNSCEIWGKVEWLDNVVTVPYSYQLAKVLAVTV